MPGQERDSTDCYLQVQMAPCRQLHLFLTWCDACSPTGTGGTPADWKKQAEPNQIRAWSECQMAVEAPVVQILTEIPFFPSANGQIFHLHVLYICEQCNPTMDSQSHKG